MGHGTPGLRPALGRGARRPPRPALVHRRAGPAEELRHQPGRARERPRGGHDLRRLVDRRVLPGPGERRARPPGPQQLRAAAVGRSAGAPARMFCDILNLDGTPVRGRPPPGAAAATSTGPASGVHVLRRPRDGVLLLRPGDDDGPPSRSTRLVLRPDHRRRRPARCASARSRRSRPWASRSSTRSTRTPRASTRSTSATPTP